ncbi:hypothetical protein IMG5_125410 [Ichthyophthirius multifiliis]|uniref:Uncharacterized protein n=1 Tax=Ichthyophthirius multifiliis TaxID=5932 RepID=G0QVQ7_ICHMU|nr:hypothetical protein IMG5_125410 [Ichthyophthirius multifiliis]EGR30701.1 hypothetical protein IMG5_125410 [Ichthyophthirius multifiliis]|eukprot:XP_004032288.1 hypothetical protein IMG5_125410 [Ichthyophthirius multifiliis]
MKDNVLKNKNYYPQNQIAFDIKQQQDKYIINMSNQLLSNTTLSVDRYNEKMQNFLKRSQVSKDQISQYTSLHSFDQKVSIDLIPQIIEELIQYEQECIKNDQYLEAEKCVKKIEELQQEEIKLSQKLIRNKNKNEILELEEMNLRQYKEFNETWDKAIFDYKNELHEQEIQLNQFHQQQQEQFDIDMKNQAPPKVKYSVEVLQLRNLLNQLIQAQALQNKLENMLQCKIRMRKQEMNKYAQWLQNMKQELTQKQGIEISKVIAEGEVRKSKIQGGQLLEKGRVGSFGKTNDVKRRINKGKRGQNETNIERKRIGNIREQQIKNLSKKE